MNFEKPPIYFDIETGPLPRDEVEKFIPKFEAPSNYKDADKIAEVVSKKEEAWFKKAALSCTTGKVLAIGFCSNKDDEDEIPMDFASDLKEIIGEYTQEANVALRAGGWIKQEETWENLSQEHISAIKEKPKEFILKAIEVAKQIGRNN